MQIDNLDTNTHLSHLCGSFLRDYIPRFRQNFIVFYKELTQLANYESASLELLADKIYLASFVTSGDDYHSVARETLYDFVKSTVYAEPILIKTWMRMFNDFVDVLEARSGYMRHINEFSTILTDLSDILYDAYFEISCQQPPLPATTVGDSKETHAILQKLKEFTKSSTANGDADGNDSHSIKMLNFYKGIPVSYPIKINNLGVNTITCQVHPHQISVLSQVGAALLKNPLLQKPIVCRADNLDKDNLSVKLSHFYYQDEPEERRKHIRVEPGSALPILMEHQKGKTEGRIIDISIATIAVYLRNDGIDVASHSKLHLALPANNGTQELSLPGKVIKIRPDSRQDTRAHVVIFRLEVSPQQESLLAAYVTKRQSELIGELNAIMKNFVSN